MKKYFVALLVAIVAFAATAFAASLVVNVGTLQAGSGEIGLCAPENATKVTYGPATFTNATWTVQSITVTTHADCHGLDFSVLVTAANGHALTETQTGVFGSNSSETIVFSTPFDATAATDVQIMIRSAPAP